MTKSHREIIRESLSEAERAAFDAALEADGIEDEIALLRLRLRQALTDHSEDPRLLTQAMNALVRAIATQHRLSPQARKELADRVSDVLNSIADQLLPADR